MLQSLDKASQTVWEQARRAAVAEGILAPIHLLYALFEAAPDVWDKLPKLDLQAIKSAVPAFRPSQTEGAESTVMLANSTKRVLAYSMEECVRAGAAPFSSAEQFVRASEWVGPEYLLLGLLRETDCDAAQLLTSHGLRLEDARHCLSQPPRPE